MERKTRKNNMILIAVLAVIALVSYAVIGFYQGANTKNGVAVVTIDGEEYGRYPLIVEITEKIKLPDGSYNVLEIKDGKADITAASCPDGICVNHQAVSKHGQSIVCLPNKVVVEIENGEESDIDFMVN